MTDQWQRERARMVAKDEASLEEYGVRRPAALRCTKCSLRLADGADHCEHCGASVRRREDEHQTK